MARTTNRRRGGWRRWLPGLSSVRRPHQWDDVKSPTKPEPVRAAKNASRRKKKRDNKKRENPLIVMISWLVPVVAAIVAFATPFLGSRAYEYLMNTGHFFAREVVVEGHAHLETDEVLALAGIEAGTHVLGSDLEAMASRIEGHRWVVRATVDRELPDRLLVTVNEHRPVALVAGTDLALVDATGEPFATLRPGERLAGLPIITGLGPEAYATAVAAADARADVRSAVNLTRLYEAMGLANRWPLGEVRVEPGRRLSVVLSEVGTEAVLGTGPYRDKLYRLEWVLEKLHQEGKTADYVLLDGAGAAGGLGDERVVVRADLAPSAAQLALAASERAERAQKSLAGLLPGASPGAATDEAAAAAAEQAEVGEGPGGVVTGVRPAVEPAWLDEEERRSGTPGGAAQGVDGDGSSIAPAAGAGSGE